MAGETPCKLPGIHEILGSTADGDALQFENSLRNAGHRVEHGTVNLEVPIATKLQHPPYQASPDRVKLDSETRTLPAPQISPSRVQQHSPPSSHGSSSQSDPATLAKRRLDDRRSASPEGYHEQERSAGNANCSFMGTCTLESPDRRVISHFFGRNKKETRAIPDDCWVTYCRQHYQRCRYRQSAPDFAALQMDLVRKTVAKLEEWGQVREWDIQLRKRATEQLKQEDAAAAERGGTAGTRGCKERALLPRVGPRKSFREVYALIDAVEAHARDNDCEALEFEVVPQYRQGYLQNRPPAPKRTKSNAGNKRPSTGGASSPRAHKA